jgi:hypothetical protein
MGNSRGHFFQNGRILVDTFGEFSWTKMSTRIPLLKEVNMNLHTSN